MQQFILIPEVPAIVRKIAPAHQIGMHVAYFHPSDRHATERAYEMLQSGVYTENSFSWRDDDPYPERMPTAFLHIHKETSNG